jgi:hypothetical protein
VVLTVVESAYGEFDQRGKPIHEGAPSAYQGVGKPAALDTLAGHYAVADAHPAMAAALPFRAMGTGPEKVRPPMRSAFGKPATVKATADQLAADRRVQLLAEQKAGNI